MGTSQKQANPKLGLDTQISLSVQQVLTFTAFLVTIGASIYTFYKALPKLDDLDKVVTELKVSNGRMEEKILALKETISSSKKNTVEASDESKK